MMLAVKYAARTIGDGRLTFTVLEFLNGHNLISVL